MLLTDKELTDAVNEAPLGRTGALTVLSVARAIETRILAKLQGQPLPDGCTRIAGCECQTAAAQAVCMHRSAQQ